MKQTMAFLIAISAVSFLASTAAFADSCVAYGNEKTDFTWRLCPAGQKYERQYIYFGAWSKFYSVHADTGACSWSALKSSWICPDRMIRCDAKRCGLS